MTRYVVMVGERWLTAIYGPDKGIEVTRIKEDASSWPNYEKALMAARAVASCTSSPVAIHSVSEPVYPRNK